MLEGNFLYKDIIDNTSPLAALVYISISFVTNYEIITFKLFFILLLFIQAIIFKSTLNSNDVLTEKGEIPTLVFVLIHCILPDFYCLSSAFLANTFILIAIGRIFKYLKSESTENEIFFTGINLGIAYMFCSQTLIFFILANITFMLFSRTKIRFYVICLLGFLFPVCSIFTYYFLFDSYTLFIDYYILNFNIDTFEINDYVSFLVYIFIPMLLFIFGIFINFSYKRFINYQIVCAQNMLAWFGITFLILCISFSKSISNFVLILPFIGYFISNIFIIYKNKKIKNILFYLFIFSSILLNFSNIYENFNIPISSNFCNQYCSSNKWNIIAENKKIAYFGKDLNIFLDNTSASPFLEPKLSFEYLKNINSYDKIIYLHSFFEKNNPELIIDDWNVVPSIFDKLPLIKEKYIKSKHYNLYERISK